jgi:hypothetical protein
MSVKFSNNAKTTLSSGITSSATSITVADGSVFPSISGSEYFYVTLEDASVNIEIVKVTAVSGNTLTVVRAQDGTSARTFSNGDKCELRLTAAGLNDVATQADTDTTYTAGSGLSLTGTEFANTAPDQTVSLTGAGATSVTGTYPNFTITSTDTNTDTDTTYTAGTGLSLTGTEFANTAPDQTVALTGAGATSISGTYPNFTITSTDNNTDTTYTAGTGLTLTGAEFSLTNSTSYMLNNADNDTVAYTNKTRFYSNTDGGSVSGYMSGLEIFQGTANADAFMTFHVGGDYAGYFGLDGTTNDLFWGGWSNGAAVKNKVWHAGNDGSGSGLDADTVDGKNTSTAESADTVVVRTGSGYLHAQYFNGTGTFSTSGASSGMARFTGTNGSDTYGRSYSAAAAGLLIGQSGGMSDIRTDLVVHGSYRDHGMFGTYSSSKTQHIWSMGTSYRNHSSGTNFGSLYGFAYKHTNNTTGGTMAGSHQAVWCHAGTPKCALGSSIWTSGNVTAYSDIRVKTNIEHIPNALDKVCQLNGYTFDRTDVTFDEHGEPETPIRQTGVIAQEVLKVLPEAVMGDEDGHYSVAYGNMVGLLIEAVKELKAEVEELKGNA